MDAEVVQTNLSNNSGSYLEDVSPQVVRENALSATRDFKNSWRNLAQALQVVWKNKLYKQWGYETFDQYTAKEINVRKHTAMKLIRSYMFLQKEEPICLENSAQGGPDNQARNLPSIDAVNTLQLAKKNLDEAGYKKVKTYLLDEGRDVLDVKKDLTALILKQRKDVNPEEERTRVNKITIGRFLSTLRHFKREIETLHILPGIIADNIEKLAKDIEECASVD